ncbi:rhodanese-like domain-containing protein [Streptomyces aurantiogriseus]|uniref:Rhodanese domain-containing protein n=1 Tax=Streptomyces aurantiogriseus TaxID=66870 RepID=A0A918CQR1_9ACTN|nr:rhodanese-like domain-containing protein [Streptomyces aurantiogriseus]GGR33719.1 hypothetical protein GCM10010251_57550 [Streptomyces aurantiogriseus]
MNLFHRGPGRVTVREAAEQTGQDRAGGPQGSGRRAGDEAMLLDVREPYEWQAGHAPRAIHVPLSALEAGAPLPAEARGRPLIVICRSGNRSRQAAELLVGRGVAAVDVIGGMEEWLRAGLPVVDQQGRDGTIA